MSATLTPRSTTGLIAALAAAATVWAGLYALNEVLWDALFERALLLDLTQRIPGAVHFFLYDTSKIILLLVGMIFVIGMVRTTLRPERVRVFLEGKPLWLSLVLAALFGAITPFCSCSSIPLFIGFVGAGIPLAVAAGNKKPEEKTRAEGTLCESQNTICIGGVEKNYAKGWVGSRDRVANVLRSSLTTDAVQPRWQARRYLGSW